MELTEKITIDMLTPDSVSVLRQQFVDYNGAQLQVGDNVRNAYSNSANDRERLKSGVAEDYYKAIITVWGDAPTVEDPAESEGF